ncbi:MAG: TetR/AcrR family transcriptional regulator [Halofilum sp. (in: g-proteobacteria)]|nr:TetR/AcrR family transcriptional regulator [Halofilum sp. (in: g-proteobacteria)]
MNARTANPAGRPAGPSRDVRSDLVATSRRLFAERGFEAVSLRAIGEAAGVTPAMVRYYFGDKLGLYEAAVEAAIEPVFARLAAAQSETGVAGIVSGLTEAYAEVAARDPWVLPLILREVLLPGGQLRERFIERFARRIQPAIMVALESARERGELAEDIDPDAAALSLVSLAVFPHLARPVVREVFGIDPSGADGERILEQMRRIYLGGVRPREAT